MINTRMKCWLGVVSKEHVMIGVKNSFVQVCHGRGWPLKRMKAGDYFIYYSPNTKFGIKDKLQSFTAIGIVKTGDVYQVKMTEDFHPFRCDVEFLKCTEVKLETIKDNLEISKDNLGFLLRRGHIEISLNDFQTISQAMRIN